jgi:hypothetical protein
MNRKKNRTAHFQSATLLASLLFLAAGTLAAQQPASDAGSPARPCQQKTAGSPYIPVDSWVYPAVLRLYSLGYVDTAFLNLRPWTRASLRNMLEETSNRLNAGGEAPHESEAQELYDALLHELRDDIDSSCQHGNGHVRAESIYSVVRGISGTPLRDSFHLGSTVVNDYGRPFESGFNNYTGASGYASVGRFALYLRGEFQGASSAAGYSPTLAANLQAIDLTTNYYSRSCWANMTACVPMPYYVESTIPAGPIATTTNGRVMEAYASAQILNHIFSFGKQDYWQGPGLGGSMSYSNNAENIYSFRINRIEPLHIPVLSRLTGPFRYEFMAGSLKGHVYPRDPWVHVEKVSFRPTRDLEFGFERTVLWGGVGHEPINIKSFLRSFFSLSAPSGSVKNSEQDPGARFGAFDFSYRLPFVRNWLTLYTDSEVHDDVSPIDAPRRAAWRPGIYLSHFPGVPKLDLRLEAASTDPPVTTSNGGHFMYWESIQRDGYTNNGQLFGDWIGREDKGGQAWLTYHLSGNEMIQVGMRTQKAAKDFIPGGTSLSDVNVKVVKRFGKDFEINGNFTYEKWKAPIYLPGEQNVTNTTIQLTWYPHRNVDF